MHERYHPAEPSELEIRPLDKKAQNVRLFNHNILGGWLLHITTTLAVNQIEDLLAAVAVETKLTRHCRTCIMIWIFAHAAPPLPHLYPPSNGIDTVGQ